MKTFLSKNLTHLIRSLHIPRHILQVIGFLMLFASGSYAQTTWYSYQSGNWTEWRTWTTDPSGTTLINPSATTPSAAANNTVIILNGRTVTIQAAVPAITTMAFTIQEGAVLDLTTNTNSHNFGSFSGSGLLRLSTATFPSFASGTFVQAGGGTVEYRNMGGFTLLQLTYNNLILNLNNGTDEVLFSSATPLTLNGDLTVEKGVLQIGDDATAVQRYVYFNGNVTVNQNGQIAVGRINVGNSASFAAASRSHQIAIQGNLYNYGSVLFTNMTAPVYAGNPPAGAQAGWSDVIFTNGSADQYVVCNGPTTFYRIQVQKGTDKTYVLHIDADAPGRFNLYGRNDSQFDNDPTDFGTRQDAPNISSVNALSLLAGTCRLGNNITLPALASRFYLIDEDVSLWLDGAQVRYYTSSLNAGIYIYGDLKLTNGALLNLDDAAATFRRGIVTRESSSIIVDNSTLQAPLIRTSSLNTFHRGAFIVSGNSVITLSGNNSHGYHATLSMGYPDNVVNISGGTINILHPTFTTCDLSGGSNGTYFSVLFGSAAKNINITGGTFNISVPNGSNAYLNSTVPFYNLNISGVNTTSDLRMVQYSRPSIYAPPTLTPKPLVVLNDLTLQSNAVLNTTVPAPDVNVSVGGNFAVSATGIYNPGDNTTRFNGGRSQQFDIQGTVTGLLYNLQLSDSTTLALNNANITQPVVVRSEFRIGPGSTFADNGRILEVRGNVENSGTHFRPVSGAGSIQLAGTAVQVILGNGSGKFNNLVLNKTGGSVSLGANMTVTGDLRLANTAARLNIGSYNLYLTVTGDVFDNISGNGRSFNRDRMIQTAGLLSDGGVSKAFSNTAAFTYPIGFYNASNTTFYYMPASIRYSIAPAAYGEATTRPVNARHPLAQTANVLSCYWKTTESGFSGVPANSVVHQYTYDPLSNYFVSGTESNYVPATYRNQDASWLYINNPVLVNDGTNVVTYDTAYTANGEYTAGEPGAFAPIQVRYSTGVNGDWNNTATWSSAAVGAPGGASVPDAGTIVIIGDETHTHTVTVNENGKVCGSLTIYEGSTLDLRNTTGHNFQAIPEEGVSGTGTLRIAANNYFPGGDFGNFIGASGGTVEYYTLGADVLMPVTSDISGLILDHYYNLRVNPGANTITFPNSNLLIYNDLIKTGTGQANTNTIAVHALVIQRDLVVESGIFEVRNTNIQQIRVYRNMVVNGTFRVQDGTAVDHTLELYGNLSGTGTFNANYGGERILTYFMGTGEASITGANKTFYSLVIDKGTNQSPVLNVRAGISTSTAFDPTVTLKNGTLRIKQSTFSLSYARSFVIPVTACLSIDSLASVTVADGNNDSTLFLIGRLEMLGGVLNIGRQTLTRRNSIEYSPEGNPEMVITGGVLNINGQIKRNSFTTFGSLDYRQNGGVVNIYGKAHDNTRAKFEICNDNSYFGFTGGTINFYRGGGVTFGDVYLRPAGTSVTGSGTFAFTSQNIAANQIFSVDAACDLGNLFIRGVDNNDSAVVRLTVNPLVLLGDLIIDNAFGRLNCSNLNVHVAGDFENRGRYTAGTNTTRFYGGNEQTALLSVNTTFRKLIVDKTAGSAVTFTNTGAFQPTITDSLTIGGGILANAGTLNILALGNITNNSIHTSTGSGSLTLQGTRNQVISGNGTGQFGNLNLANGAANGATLSADITVNGTLALTSGAFYLNDYLLTLSSSAAIAGSPGNFALKNWIITNGVLSDQGIRKIYPAVSPATFIFPVGVADKYTPVSYAVSFTAASPGSITVKPVNIKIPSLTNVLTDELQYYWNVSSTPFGGLTSVTHAYTYLQADVTGNEANYVGARYYNNNWTNLGTGVMNTTANTITLIQDYIDGEYTCGEPGNFLTKPVYYSYDLASGITTTGADWNTAASWATGGHNGTPAPVPPDGNPMIIKAGHRINVTNDDRMAYSVVNDGVLNLNSTVGHSFGHVSGIGRIIMSNTPASQFVFPGGDFAEFMNTAGSTVEYFGATGPAVSSISPTLRSYQNLEFTGPVSKYLSSVNILVRGHLRITGSQLMNNVYNKNIILWGDWMDELSNGFVPGKGLVSLSGSTLQTITTPNPEHFYNLAVNNPAGAVLDGSAEISNRLTLLQGNIRTTAGDLLTITNTATNAVTGGSDASFVDGPLRKRILSGQSFDFPVGNFNAASAKPLRYGNMLVSGVNATDYWTAQYVNASPDPAYNRANLLSPITSVSDNEYWVVTRPGGGSANVRLRWDAFSNIASVNSTRVTEWVTPANRWEEKGGVLSGNLTSGTVATSTPVTTNNYVFTLGVSGVTARITSVSPAEICNNGEAVTVTVLFTGTPNWTLTYQAGGNTFTQSGITSAVYAIQLTGADLGGPGLKNIWLTAVSDASANGIVDPTTYPVTVKDTYIPDIQGTFAVGAGELRNYATTDNGSTYAWSWQGTSGGSIASPASAATNITMAGPGNYQLRVIETSSNGCVAADIQSITVVDTPSPDITPDDPNICQNETVTYTTPDISGHTYLWTVTGGTPASGTGNSIAVTWNTAGNGSVMVEETNSGITGTDILNVVVDPQPLISLIVTAPASVCEGSTAIINVAGSQSGMSYQLREGVVNIGSSVAGTGGNINLPSGLLYLTTTFNVLAYNNGCSEQLTTTPTVTVNPLPAAAGTITGTPTVCQGQNGVSYSVGPIANATSYTWSYTGTGATITGSTNAVTISFAANATSGTLTVQGTNGCGSGTASIGYGITVNPLPAPAGTITGTATVCQGQNGVSYSVGAIANATSYTWNYTGTGASITGSTNAISISFAANATSGTLTVQGTNGCGSGTVSAGYNITVNPLPGAAGAITGTPTVCQGQTGVTYSVGAIANATSYTWSYTGTGATITGSTNAITISYAANATSGTLTVQGTNGCGNGTVSAGYAITVNPLPGAAGAITGTPAVCQGQNGVSYSIGAIANATSYTWNYTGTGATITGSTNAVTISFAANATSGTLTVQGTNGCGNGTVSAGYAITVNPLPAAAGAVTGTPTVCQGQTGVTYSVGAIANATSYIWSYSGTGATITGSTNSVTISFAANATSGTLTVQGTSACGSGTVSAGYSITVNPLPAAAGAITGTPTVCQGQTGVTYSVGAIANATSYTWNYSGTGATITGSTNAVTISFAANATSGTLTVQGTNACGSGAASSGYAIMVNPLPAAAGTITGSAVVVQGQSNVSYSTGVIPNASSYMWSYTGTGATITGSSNTVTISFAGNATSGTLTVQGMNGCGTGAISPGYAITVNLPPAEAGFSASATVICAGEEIVFTDESLGVTPGTLYQWNFGTGAVPATATGSGPHAVRYTTAGAKTVELVIDNGSPDVLVKPDYITVNPVPAVALETADRCGAGTVEFTALVTDGDQVEFSADGGSTVLSTDDNPPFVYAVELAASSSLQIWARALNTVTGCTGTWDSSALAVSLPVPVAETILSAHTGTFPAGYVDVICAGKQNALYYVNGDPLATYNWSVPELGITAGGTMTLEIDWEVPGGDYTLTVVKTSPAGCVSAVRDTLVLVSQPEPDLGDQVSICGDDSYTFDLSGQFENYEWHDFSTGDTYTATSTGLVSVRVWDAYNCTGTDSAQVTLYPDPQVDLGNDTVLCGDNYLLLDAGDFTAYDWSTGEVINPITVREGAGMVSVTVTDENGCQASDEIMINECSPETLLGTIPNTFTPNQDNIHDTWEIRNIYLFPDADIHVFDRWGRLVFRSDGGYSNNWYGTGPNGKDLPVDSYYYIIDLKVKGIKPLTGTVSIIR